jgi:hypothetical protein
VHAAGKTKNSECYVQWFLKPSSEVAQATCGGSFDLIWFESPMVHVQQLQWEPLQVRVRRVKIRLVHLYKIQHGLSLHRLT